MTWTMQVSSSTIEWRVLRLATPWIYCGNFFPQTFISLRRVNGWLMSFLFPLGLLKSRVFFSWIIWEHCTTENDSSKKCGVDYSRNAAWSLQEFTQTTGFLSSQKWCPFGTCFTQNLKEFFVLIEPFKHTFCKMLSLWFLEPQISSGKSAAPCICN